MAKYRKKPVVIEAYRTDVEEMIQTLEGTMKASPGDWIVTGIKGERYPVKHEIFVETYEPAITVDQEGRPLSAGVREAPKKRTPLDDATNTGSSFDDYV